MMHKIVLAGGTGFLGTVLIDYYKMKAEEIVVLTRTAKPAYDNVRFVIWDGNESGSWTKELEQADLLVNLCGKNVNCRYTAKNRKEIVDSRVRPTVTLGKAIASLQVPPKTWINLASATIYRHAEDRPQDEFTGETGSGFSIDVCNRWEASFTSSHTPHTKKIILRVGIVLGRLDGVLPRLKNLVLAGLGGHQGTGKQFISWLHQQDFARIVDWVHIHGKDGDVFNATSPNAISNHDFMKELRKTIGIPFGLPSPQWLLEIGAMIIGTETELILKSRWVVPGKLIQSGFTFQFPFADAALHDLLSTRD